MRTSLRLGLRTTSILTVGVAGWLVAAIASGRAARGQDLVLLWSIVAGASIALVWLTVVATRPIRRPLTTVDRLFALLGVVAAGFGLFVLGSETTRASGGEAYLFGIGLVLTIHGLLAVAWSLLRVFDPLR